MLKTKNLLLALILSASAVAQFPSLKGFEYGNISAPDGTEWQSPERLSLNKEQPRAYFFSFKSTENARKVLPENSEYWQSLNGEWKFHFAKNPDERPKDFYKTDYNVSDWDNIPVPVSWNIHGIQKDGSLKYGVPIYVNQPVIFQHKVAVDDWRGGVMRTPPAKWTTYEYRNEVGSFRRDFTVPQTWDGRQIFISFDGVDSFFYLWINGQYVGFSKNSRNAARFDITPYLKKGVNTLAVEVYRSSDGSFLEAQDMFRLPGIFRAVAIYSTPKFHIRDFQVIPNYNNGRGTLDVKMELRNSDKKKTDISKYKISYSLYENKLYSDENTPIMNYEMPVVAQKSKVVMQPSGLYDFQSATMTYQDVKPWSAEAPHRYTLVAELKDAKNQTLETVSTYIGFRSVEIRDTKAEDDEFGLAGRYYYINNKTVKLKGVNRHETNPATGKVISREQMKEEVMMMKRANINHVRNSHYPDDPYWYYLCDKYGIYLEDEANIESHQYYYGDASLSHPKEWEAAHVARVMEMVHSDINHPSIVIWSLGNEAGPGKNFVSAYNALKKADTSRPVQYERNNDIVDMGSNQYPSIDWMRGAVKGNYKIKYPFHVSEYAHSMGNACGNLVDYWEAIESTNFFMGGAIWDWIDQAMYYYDKKTGERYQAYGGDFGDTPNDGQFVMNGIIFADLKPKPQYFEVKKVYQYISVKETDIAQGKIEIFNKNYFKDLSDYRLVWALYEDGKEAQTGELSLGNVAPRAKSQFTLPFNAAAWKPDAEYFVKLQFLLNEDKPWAKKGYVQAEEQLLVKSITERPSIADVTHTGEKLQWKPEGKQISVKGKNFDVKFDTATGTIYSLQYGNETVIEDGKGPKLNAFRAFVNNDNWAYRGWFENGLHNLQHSVLNYSFYTRPDGCVVGVFTVKSQAPCGAEIIGNTDSGRFTLKEKTDSPFNENNFHFITHQIFTIYPDGSVELQASITSSNPGLDLARLGYVMRVPKKYENFTYYGRGSIGNYADRKTGQFIERHTSTVDAQFVPFPKPQDCGNHENVRWAALTDSQDAGAVFIAEKELSVQALPYSALDMTLKPHTYQLSPIGDTYLCLDLGVTGLGGNSCGQGPPLVKDRIKAAPHTMGFIIRPAGKNLTAIANIRTAGELPITIKRNKNGEVTISSEKKGAKIMYQLSPKEKAKEYAAPISLRQGGEVTAWYADNKQLKTAVTFTRMENVATEVIYASSEEIGEEDAKFLVDGDPSTIWHTMYSVTVAKYPHWVDFDMGSEKMVKGITYLPRQDGATYGDVKDFTIHVSADGKEWGEPILKSTFPHNKAEQRVMFDKPIKARYVRFTALSEQRGRDYASGAEFGVLAD